MRAVHPSENLPPLGPPEWLGPPQDTMGGVVPVDAAVVRTGHMFVGFRAVTAYSTGISLGLVLAVRRRALGEARWESLRGSFFTGLRPRGLPPDDERAIIMGR